MSLKFRRLIWNIFKTFLFRLDAEWVHHGTILLIKVGIFFGNRPLMWVSGTKKRNLEGNLEKNGDSGPSSGLQVFGLPFLSPIGLAAGFDKNAEILVGLPALGFGFAEIGTVTPKPQSGNLRPRLFRDSQQQALFNRMGFNNLGATLIAERLRVARPQLPAHFRVGVNFGKNKDTPLEQAKEDYIKVVRLFDGLADYLVMNVSSPNTPGLRSLQTVEALKPIVEGVVDVISAWNKRPPLLLKLAPEIETKSLVELIRALEPCGIDGWVLTNTLAGTYELNRQSLPGGWSGQPLSHLSMASLQTVRRVTCKPIISVGGIHSKEESDARLSAGASLIQIYTGWIFEGPTFPTELLRRI